MANSFATTVWTIDTTFVAASAPSSGKVHIQGFAWDASASGTSVLVTTDGTKSVWSAQSTANEKNITVDFPKSLIVDKIGVTTLGSGTLYIYHG